MNTKLLLFILLLPTVLIAETSDTYLVYVKDYPNVSASKAIINYGKKDNRQPYAITFMLQPNNTNYLLVSISTQTKQENDFLNTQIKEGKMKLIKRTYMKKYKGQEYLGSDYYSELPKDIDINWATEISTP